MNRKLDKTKIPLLIISTLLLIMIIFFLSTIQRKEASSSYCSPRNPNGIHDEPEPLIRSGFQSSIQLNNLSEKILEAEHQEDPNCYFILAHHYINNGDLSGLKRTIDSLVPTYERVSPTYKDLSNLEYFNEAYMRIESNYKAIDNNVWFVEAPESDSTTNEN